MYQSQDESTKIDEGKDLLKTDEKVELDEEKSCECKGQIIAKEKMIDSLKARIEELETDSIIKNQDIKKLQRETKDLRESFQEIQSILKSNKFLLGINKNIKVKEFIKPPINLEEDIHDKFDYGDDSFRFESKLEVKKEEYEYDSFNFVKHDDLEDEDKISFGELSEISETKDLSDTSFSSTEKKSTCQQSENYNSAIKDIHATIINFNHDDLGVLQFLYNSKDLMEYKNSKEFQTLPINLQEMIGLKINFEGKSEIEDSNNQTCAVKHIDVKGEIKKLRSINKKIIAEIEYEKFKRFSASKYI
ncbi:1973_t:CDS:1 [Funneliformis geosporum]|uniref:1892_t:CDS:1 n=1 Tax=Funneliformis geosporum TaxID=1117311 RepID=A0A9W4WTT7_9GLOM|nr:1973_t:CDS:1 [Funneliformis geosporum]CAI2171669.1 1892_t:CDS:1 [Funneliformis geosporum]